MKSLLILGLPRSATTALFGLASRSLCSQLDFPGENPRTGEFLNLIETDVGDGIRSVSYFERPPFARWVEFKSSLDEHQTGLVVKDVVHLYIVKKYLDENPDSYNVVWVDRPIADVVSCWLDRGWFDQLRSHPDYQGCEDIKEETRKLYESGKLEQTMLEGARIVREECLVGRYESVDYDRFIESEDYIFDVLEGFGYRPIRSNWHDWIFKMKRDSVMRKRETKLWGELNQCCMQSTR